MPNQRYIGGKTRDPLVDIKKGLQVRQMHHDEKGLLKRIDNSIGNSQDLMKDILNALRQGSS